MKTRIAKWIIAGLLCVRCGSPALEALGPMSYYTGTSVFVIRQDQTVLKCLSCGQAMVIEPRKGSDVPFMFSPEIPDPKEIVEPFKRQGTKIQSD